MRTSQRYGTALSITLALLLSACSSSNTGGGSSPDGGGAGDGGQPPSGSNDGKTSPATGPACKTNADCEAHTCNCNDGQTESFDKACILGKCEAQDVCVRMHMCGGHGGVVGAADVEKKCGRAIDCPAEYCLCDQFQGAPQYLCSGGYCIYDDRCTPLPACVQ